MRLITKLFDYILPSDIKHLKIAEFGYFLLTILFVCLMYFRVLSNPKLLLSHDYIFYIVVMTSILWLVAVFRVKKLKKLEKSDNANKNQI